MTIIEKACNWATNIANDNSHGYSQVNRLGPDYDCSSLVITAFREAGLPVQATYTGDMFAGFTACGFKDIKGTVNLVSGFGLQRGDILLNEAQHTCLYVGDGKVVNARCDTDCMQGDSHGDEIRIQSYWNYGPWDYVLRYEGENKHEVMPQNAIRSYFCLQYGDGINCPLSRVKAWQALLCEWGFKCDIDGEFGKDTEAKTKMFQEYVGIDVNGIVDELCWLEAIHIEAC